MSAGPPSQSVIGFTTRLMKTPEGTYGRGPLSFAGIESSICGIEMLLRSFGCACADVHRLRRRGDTFGSNEPEARVPQPGQQPVQGSLVDGCKREQRVATRQQAQLFATKEAGASLVEVAGDSDLVAVHGPDVRAREA